MVKTADNKHFVKYQFGKFKKNGFRTQGDLRSLHLQFNDSLVNDPFRFLPT